MESGVWRQSFDCLFHTQTSPFLSNMWIWYVKLLTLSFSGTIRILFYEIWFIFIWCLTLQSICNKRIEISNLNGEIKGFQVRDREGREGHALFDLMPKNFSTINKKFPRRHRLSIQKLTQYFLSSWWFFAKLLTAFLNEKFLKKLPLLFWHKKSSWDFTTRKVQNNNHTETFNTTRLEVHRRILEQKPAFPFQYMRKFPSKCFITRCATQTYTHYTWTMKKERHQQQHFMNEIKSVSEIENCRSFS